jgi:hypothetical protein
MPASAGLNIPESAYQLGDLREDFRISRAQLVMCLVCVVLLFSFFGSIAWTLAPMLFAWQNAEDLVFSVGFLAMFLFAGGWIVVAFRKIFLNRHMRVLIFDDGLVVIRHDQVFVARWDEIEWTRDEVIQQNKAFIQQCTICLRSGKTFVLSNLTDLLADYERLVATIVEQADTRRLPEALAELEAGRMLCFGGGLQLTPEGIVHGGRLLPWAEVHSIQSDLFRVAIERRGAWLTWATVPSGNLHSRFLLKTLVNRFKDAQPADDRFTAPADEPVQV